MLFGGIDEPAKLALIHVALADLVRRNFGRLGQNTPRQLFGAHFQR